LENKIFHSEVKTFEQIHVDILDSYLIRRISDFFQGKIRYTRKIVFVCVACTYKKKF
jgi:hypothetical protein